VKRYIPLALVLLGGLLVSKSVYYYGKGALANVLLTRAWEKSKETKSHHNPWSWADMHPVGRIEIESVGLSSVVLNTISGEALAFGPGHLSSTPKPGRPGNIVLAGHRDGHFRKLKNVQEGDLIKLESQFATQNYTVTEITPTAGNDIYWVDETETDCITLITCYPFNYVGQADDRFVVRGMINNN